MPFFLTGSVQNTVRFQTASDFKHTGTFKVFPVNAFHNFSFFRHYYKMLILILCITEEPSTIYLDFALLEAGKHAKALNELLELFSSDLENEVKMKEFLGHTPLQVFFGAVLGAAVALIIG